MKIVFMGTPDFAIPALKKLIHSDLSNVCAIYTKPPTNKYGKLIKSPVHILAEQHNLEIRTPIKFSSATEVEKLKALRADLIVVVAYGIILPKPVLESAKWGCINLHPSDLPKFRGAAPIQHTIINGEKKTAICIIQMDEGMDTGDIISREHINIPDDMTSLQLHDLASDIGAKMIISLLPKISSQMLAPIKQSIDKGEAALPLAHKISQKDELIDWSADSDKINCKIRALSPRPGAYFLYDNQRIKIIKAKSKNTTCNNPPGYVTKQNGSLEIACGGGSIIEPELLQRQGKKMIYVDAFLRGFDIPDGTIL